MDKFIKYGSSMTYLHTKFGSQTLNKKKIKITRKKRK